jgi:hypothetical protein
MKITECKTLTATAVIGLQRGYEDAVIPDRELKAAIVKIQQELKNEQIILLSVKATPCEILFLGQEEPSVALDFIQYPKFHAKEKDWTEGVTSIVKKLMAELGQNRTVIVFPDRTVMIENSDEIDPRIKLTSSL